MNFNGSIDEVMIFNRSLSSSEVMDLYLNGVPGNDTANITTDQDIAVSSKEVEWESPTAFQTFNNNNYMFNIETENGDLVVSPEHMVYVRPFPLTEVRAKARAKLGDIMKKFGHFFKSPLSDSGEEEFGVVNSLWLMVKGLWVKVIG